MKDAGIPLFEIRAAGKQDDDAILELCRAALLPEDTVDIDGLERYLWGDSAGSDRVNVVAESSGSVIGVAFGHVATTGTDVSGHVGLFAVAESWHRGGIGAALLANLESSFAEAGASEVVAGGTQPYFWWPGVDLRYSSAIAMLRSRAYEEDDEVANMDVDLHHADLATHPLEGVDVRRLQPNEYTAFESWMRETWDDEWASEVTLAMRRDPVSCWVAMSGSDFVGFAAYSTNRRGWFGPMGSTEAVRGRGLGRVLLRHCLQDMKDRGDESCEICWIGPEKFYADAVGATVGRRFLQFHKYLSA